jgi:hypothetical protein
MVLYYMTKPPGVNPGAKIPYTWENRVSQSVD